MVEVIPVLAQVALVDYRLPLSVTTTIVSLPEKEVGGQGGISMTPCGMDTAVPMATIAALMQVCRGSAGHCQLNQRKTLRCACATMKKEATKTSDWSF